MPAWEQVGNFAEVSGHIVYTSILTIHDTHCMEEFRVKSGQKRLYAVIMSTQPDAMRSMLEAVGVTPSQLNPGIIHESE